MAEWDATANMTVIVPPYREAQAYKRSSTWPRIRSPQHQVPQEESLNVVRVQDVQGQVHCIQESCHLSPNTTLPPQHRSKHPVQWLLYERFRCSVLG